MIFSTLLLLFPFSLAVDVWTPFLNDEGLEYDASEFKGLELAKFDTQRGGSGGAQFKDDCEKSGGLKTIAMQCGTFVGSFNLQCKNNRWSGKRGLGKDKGHGGTQTLPAEGITKVVINAGSYVDRMTFYKGKSAVRTCGRSGGGHRYTATAPPGMQLCGMMGRAGWWMDGIAAGWCKKPRQTRKTPPRPKTPGCYVFTPTGCPKQKFDAHKWTRDTWGEANRNAGASKSRCLSTRKREYDVWCGAKNTVMHFNAMPNPRTNGCYVLTPSGCPKQKFNARVWTRDGWGEMHRNGRYNRIACLTTRKREYDAWCGSKDTKMFWNQTPYPKKPTAPGCYVFTPTGCPKQKFNARSYVRDSWGEAHRNAGSSRSRCSVTRAREFNKWCGSSDTQMHFVPLKNPTKPGCWVLTPTGCPKQKYNARVWTKDVWGEAHRHATFNKIACLATRKREFDVWCGAKDTKMFWNRTPFPARPKKPGCYVFTPSGCPKQQWAAKTWTRDTWGESHRNAGASRSRCIASRKREFDNWCGAKDTYMHFNKMPKPTASGCYVLTPSGCPKQKFNARVWTRDTWGEMHRNARYHRNGCLKTRTNDFNKWCGAKDTQMVWNRTPLPTKPRAPGCYVFTPSGCPKQKFNAKTYVRDSWGIAHRNAGASRTRCMVTRRNEFNTWCGSKDAQLHFVPLARPTKPGCWVLTPTGCPKQKYNARVWTRDTWGEVHRNARHNRGACLTTRKGDFDRWCGAKDTKMHWIRSPFPARPKTPGCYVYSPSGCPKQKWNSAGKFVRDTWGETNRNAGASRSRCLSTRKRDFDTWCGSKDTYMHFNPMPNPTKSGCWVLTPTGCPKQKFNARLWTKDSWGEANRGAIFNQNACLSTRKREYDSWCGARDTKMVWIRTPFPGRPRTPGCYVFSPSGCPKQQWNSGGKFVRDPWGEANRNAGASRSRCLTTRKKEYDAWCGSRDTYMQFNPMPNPTKPGCWVLTPTGCPKQKFNARTWYKDIWGETHRNARYNRNACLKTRTAEYNAWCGAKDTKIVFVPTPMPPRPTKPGCWVFTPTGCPKQKWNSAGKFVLDTWGIVNRNAGASRARCLTTRKKDYNAWCGAGDTHMHYVAFGRPKTPGCYVLTPTGCPKQKYNARVWTRDTWGEANRHAKFNRAACLKTRKQEFDRWCGAKDTAMHWNKTKFPPRPNQPGCYVFSPSGCPKQAWNSAGKFVRDTWGEVNRNAAASKSRCLSTRKREFNTWCGAKDTYMHWVKPTNPTAAGCYVLTPSGCPKQKFNARVWTRDSWGEQHRNARYNRNACLKTRTNEFNVWCGAKDTKMFWKASPMPGRPSAPGCYVFTPTGCPKQRWKATSFIRDTWGEKNRNAYQNRHACLVTRKKEFNAWCGAGDTQMIWNRPPAQCKVKYTKRWPHCTNIRCFQNTARLAVKNECAKNPKCDGFSYTAGNPVKGSGCLKQNCRPDNVKGYGQKSHMYFQCKPAKPQPAKSQAGRNGAKWFRMNKNGFTFDDANKFCVGKGKQLCSYKELCPKGLNHSAITTGNYGDMLSGAHRWTPVRDDHNLWVHTGASGWQKCRRHDSIPASQGGGFPAWGLTGSKFGHHICCARAPVYQGPQFYHIPKPHFTYNDASRFCKGIGRELCSYREMCPRGVNHSPIFKGNYGNMLSAADRWAPARDKNNLWIHTGASAWQKCRRHDSIPSSQGGGYPSWGLTGSKFGNHICCAETKCTDTPNWNNGLKYTCKDYEYNGWCSNGKFTANNLWTGGSPFKHPERNCCACGRGKPAQQKWLSCDDEPNWHNRYKYTCSDYAKLGWCKDGQVINKKQSGSWFKNPSEKCCVCGRYKTSPVNVAIEPIAIEQNNVVAFGIMGIFGIATVGAGLYLKHKNSKQQAADLYSQLI